MEAGKSGEAMTYPAFSIIENQLDSDLEDRKARSDVLWVNFMGWVMAQEITPEDARALFRRLFEEYL